MRSVGDATHYHADYVVPYWATSLVKIGKVGSQYFYRWTGNWGAPAAFNARYAGIEPVVDLAAAPSQTPCRRSRARARGADDDHSGACSDDGYGDTVECDTGCPARRLQPRPRSQRPSSQNPHRPRRKSPPHQGRRKLWLWGRLGSGTDHEALHDVEDAGDDHRDAADH